MSVFIVHESESDTDCPRGPVACAKAVLVTEGTSAPVTIWESVPVVDSPGASFVVVPSVTAPYTSSVTVILQMQTSPVFVTL